MMKIVSFGQQVLLDAEMTVINQITVELQDGRQVSVPAAEETVQALMKLHAGIPLDKEVIPPAVPDNVTIDPSVFENYSSDEMYDEEDEEIDPGEIGDAVMGVLAEEPMSQPAGIPKAIGQPQTRAQPRVDADGFMLAPKARTVPKDEMGYPIVQRKQQVPKQRQLIADEDGEQI
jgi:hypothetical protein